jgi:3-dehydroquinate dehydratase
MELREYISDYLTREVDLYADETVKQYQEQLQIRLDVQMSNIEGHINDKINKMTEDIISITTSRIINEEVNKRVDEKLRKIRKAIDDSI